MNFNRETNVKRPIRILYRIFGIILIIFGLLLTIVYPIPGVISGVFGCLLLQIASRSAEIQKKAIPKHPFKRPWQSIVIILYTPFVMAGILIPTAIRSISINGDESITLEVPNTKQIVFQYEPKTANANEIKCISSDEKIATVSIDKSTEGEIKCTVKPLSAGTATITCTALGVSSSPINLHISDPAAEEAAKKAEAERKAAEEAAKAEAERKAAEEAAKAEAERKAAEEAAKNEPKGDAAITVYITKSGKRYHYDSNCNGGTYFESTLEEAKSRGLTPCNKCA